MKVERGYRVQMQVIVSESSGYYKDVKRFLPEIVGESVWCWSRKVVKGLVEQSKLDST